MTQEQREEFDNLIEQLEFSQFKHDWQYSHDEVVKFMQAAHNAAVRKCAETVQPSKTETSNTVTYHVGVDKDSILKNLIP